MIRKARQQDITRILPLFDKARLYMRANGNLEQWSDGYPDSKILTSDIENGNFYVEEKDGKIMGGFAFILGNDPTYFKIEGKWLNDEPYGTIHRLVSSPGNNGFADRCFKFCIDVVGNVRVDTHRDNIPMKKAILRNGFQYCGIIYLANGAPRDAFHFDPEKVK